MPDAGRSIVYITGTRADFGLMRATLLALDADPGLDVSIIAAGMHFSAAHGETIHEVEAAGLPIIARVPVDVSPATGATMARGIGTMVTAFTDALEAARPDIVLLLGDRGEMLAGAIAGLHLNLVVAHIHGGERSGTVDEPVRHAISKLAHLHLTATEDARVRLVAMGEAPTNIFVTGAPGLDGLADAASFDRAAVMTMHRLDPTRPVALMVYHPVLQVADRAGEEAAMVLDAILECGAQALVLMPNADAGSDAVRAALEARRGLEGVALLTHLARPDFIAAMATADLMVGNSSAGIIEAASFGTPVVNIGSRQRLRERNANVVDVESDRAELRAAIRSALSAPRHPIVNVYGDGHAAARIVAVLRDTPIDRNIVMKTNAY